MTGKSAPHTCMINDDDFDLCCSISWLDKRDNWPDINMFLHPRVWRPWCEAKRLRDLDLRLWFDGSSWWPCPEAQAGCASLCETRRPTRVSLRRKQFAKRLWVKTQKGLESRDRKVCQVKHIPNNEEIRRRGRWRAPHTLMYFVASVLTTSFFIHPRNEQFNMKESVSSTNNNNWRESFF